MMCNGCRNIPKRISKNQNVDSSPIYNIPRLENIIIDGHHNDWNDEGFRVNLLTPVGHKLKSVADHDARMRLAWNNQGLIILMFVRDNVWIEAESEERLWKHDAIEIFLTSKDRENTCHWIIAPGMDTHHKSLRWHLYDHRRNKALKKIPAELNAARIKTQKGYVLEVLVPWKSLAITPVIGQEVRFQAWVNDADQRKGITTYNAAWFPGDNPTQDTRKMYQIRLSENSSSPVEPVCINSEYNQYPRARIHVATTNKRVGRTIKIRSGKQILAQNKLKLKGGRAAATFSLAMPCKQHLKVSVKKNDDIEIIYNKKVHFGQHTVKAFKDVSFLEPGRKEKCDIYMPECNAKSYPGIIIIHGGGFTIGDKAQPRELNIANNLTKEGYTCMSVNYILRKDKRVWPRNLHDCKTAVRFLRKNADRFHVNPDKIGAIGGSAGGTLATMVGITEPKDGFDPPGPYGEYSCRIQAVVAMYCGVNTSCISPDDPPFLILHGTADRYPVESSKNLAKALKKAGVKHQLVIIEGARHSFHLQPKQRDLRPLVIGFFNKYLK
jgi:acetyl esterase/lipase